MIRAGDDVHIWQWLETLLKKLGANGMSSEDTDIGIDREYRVKLLLWRREMDDYLDMIDAQRYQGTGAGHAPAGSKPIRRLRYQRTPPSTRDVPKKLPEALYDEKWLASADKDYREVTLSVSRENFEWLMFHSEEVE